MNQDPRIKSIKVIPPHGLEIRWKDKSSHRVDMTGVLWQHPAFAPLRDVARFAEVEIINWGHGIEWPEDGLDYAAQNLQRLARAQREMAAGDFSAWQARLKLSNQEAADVLGVTLSTIKNYRSGRPLPRPTQLACKVIEDDRILLDAFYRPRITGRPKAKTDEQELRKRREPIVKAQKILEDAQDEQELRKRVKLFTKAQQAFRDAAKGVTEESIREQAAALLKVALRGVDQSVARQTITATAPKGHFKNISGRKTAGGKTARKATRKRA